MGVAVIVPGVSFEDANLGKVHLSGDVPLTSLRIVAEDEYTGTSERLSVSYTPIITTQKGVTWSIKNGSQYATINNMGILIINNSAKGNDVVVRVASTDNPAVYDEKIIKVTYDSGGKFYRNVSALIFNGAQYFDTNINADNNTVAEVEAQIANNFCAIFGLNENNNNFGLARTDRDKLSINCGSVSGMVTSFIVTNLNDRNAYELSNRTLKTNGSTSETFNGGAFTSSGKIRIGWFNGTTSLPAFTGKMFKFTLTKYTEKVLECLPCVLVSDISAAKSADNKSHSIGECGMIDVVSEKFYANIGSGDFTFEE